MRARLRWWRISLASLTRATSPRTGTRCRCTATVSFRWSVRLWLTTVRSCARFRISGNTYFCPRHKHAAGNGSFVAEAMLVGAAAESPFPAVLADYGQADGTAAG